MTLPTDLFVPNLSGDRFKVQYRITGSEEEAWGKARNIAVEQTVEFPVHLIPDSNLLTEIVGQLEAFTPVGEGVTMVTISYPVEIVGAELTQLINVVQGLSSLIDGVRVEALALPRSLLAHYRGPRFGSAGWHDAVQVWDRPLLCTAIKPMGLTNPQLADMAYRCALGGIDIVKDDHGLADQPFSRFEERVPVCAEAVARANAKTGRHAVYAPNITAPADQILSRARFAREAGAGALLIAPAIVGFDAVRMVADDDRVALPILSHPTLSGNFVGSEMRGFSYYAYYGQLHRLAGADSPIFVNHGGRFPTTRADSEGLLAGCTVPMGDLKPAMPCPGGGMTLERIDELRDMYGSDAILLFGGGLHSAGDDLTENVRTFVQMLE